MASPWQTRAPFEILSHIFLLCLPNDDEPIKMHPGDIPLVFATICSLWRSVALHTPRLWSCLDVRFIDSEAAVHALHKWLSLSDPLEITLTARPNDSSEHPVSIDMEIAYIAALFSHAARWKSVQLRLTHLQAVPALSSIQWFSSEDASRRPLLQSLEHLELNVPAKLVDDQDISDSPFLSAISACPNLISLHVGDWRPIVTFHKDCLPNTLQELHVINITQGPFSLDNFVSCISRCTALTSLYLGMPNLRTFLDGRIDTIHPVDLPNLIKLTLFSSTHRASADVIRSFVLPSLDTLYLYVYDDNSDLGPFLSVFTELIHQCGHGLRVLLLSEFDTPFMSPDLLREMGEGLVALECLHLYETLATTYILDLLSTFTLRRLPNGQLAPRQNLVLHDLFIDVADTGIEDLMQGVRSESHEEELADFYDLFLHIADLVHSRSTWLFSLQDNSVAVRHFSTLSLGPNLWKVWSLFSEEMRVMAGSEDRSEYDSMASILHDPEVNEDGFVVFEISM